MNNRYRPCAAKPTKHEFYHRVNFIKKPPEMAAVVEMRGIEPRSEEKTIETFTPIACWEISSVKPQQAQPSQTIPKSFRFVESGVRRNELH